MAIELITVTTGTIINTVSNLARDTADFSGAKG
jgi:hypothetical protein